MFTIVAFTASAIFASLAADVASAASFSCAPQGLNNAAGVQVQCTGPITGHADSQWLVDFTPVIGANFMQHGQNATVDPSTCYFDTWLVLAAPAGRILIGGSMTPLPGSASTSNSNQGPHAASLKYAWGLPNTDVTFYGYLDGFGNYKLCSVNVTGWWDSAVTCSC